MALGLKYFSNTAPVALATGMTTGDTAVELTDGSSYPDPATPGNGDYTIIIGFGSSREEVCTVTAKPSADILTVTRAQDGTSATAKNIGDVVVHGVSAREFNDIQSKVDKTGATMTGSLVLDDDPTVALGAATKQYVDGSVPLGAIISYGGTSAPTGWHLCNGTAHGSAALQAVIGSANAPDLRNRFVVGAGSTYADKATGGAATVTLTAAQSGVPAHTHTNTVGNQSADHNHTGTTGGMGANWSHSHTQARTYFAQYNGTNQDGGLASWPGVYGVTAYGAGTLATNNADISHTHVFNTGSNVQSHNHTVTIKLNTAASASSSHENRPPYYALTYIIKTV